MLVSKRLITTSATTLDSFTVSKFSNLLSSLNKKSSTANDKKQSLATASATPGIGTQTTTSTSIPRRSTVSAYKRSTHPTSVPLSKLFSNSFPLSVKESLEDYKLRHQPLKFQADLLSLLPFFPFPDSIGRSSEVLKVTVDDEGHYINEFVIYPPGKSRADESDCFHLIMIHGYGAGLGFYLKNFDKISMNSRNWIVHSIDLFGYGCSSRPKFHPDNLNQVEDWFHDSFQTWMEKRNIPGDKTIIMAHSMGAYLMATYGIKRDPKFCSKLLMVSPGAVIKHRKKVSVPKYFKRLWERNISPFSIVRKAGPLGSKVVSGWSSRRFAKLTSKESKLLHKYSYAIFQGNGSGEYMLNYLLAPGADARHPLIERGIHKLQCDVSWWYGKEDWMDKKGGELCSNIINNTSGVPGKSDVKVIEDSGHHIYLDNIDKFNSMVIQEMQKVETQY
ncbi:Cardiolipin-specific deacylase 1, mitochondrial [Candida viswanathii]|uniref:Cardiolipin-specific deacylase 1, mitochondrial n=1 Tax=Candida viswanathii TaxID=5486 RepID=A0A367XVR8_9ASCO|nr:Cardiolipin-specific deacylase 1, mitochondrial [Candida viswanathii]